MPQTGVSRIPPLGTPVSVTKEKRGDSIRVKLRWTVNGKQTGISKTFPPHQGQGQAIAAYIESVRMAKRRHIIPQLTIMEFLDKAGTPWERGLTTNSIRLYKSVIRTWVLPYLGDTVITDLTPRAVRSFASQIESDATRKASLSALSHIARTAVDLGYLDTNPVSVAEVGRRTTEVKERRILESPEQLTKLTDLIRTTNPALGDAIEVTTWCGLRIGEVCALTPADYDEDRHILTISHQITRTGEITAPKWGSSRSIPVGRRAHEIIMGHIEGKDISTPLFDCSPLNLNPEAWSKATHIKKRAATLGVEDFHVHDLRHTGLTWMVPKLSAAGMSIHVISKIAGHKTIRTTEHYLHTVDRDIQEAARVLWD